MALSAQVSVFAGLISLVDFAWADLTATETGRRELVSKQAAPLFQRTLRPIPPASFA